MTKQIRLTMTKLFLATAALLVSTSDASAAFNILVEQLNLAGTVVLNSIEIEDESGNDRNQGDPSSINFRRAGASNVLPGQNLFGIAGLKFEATATSNLTTNIPAGIAQLQDIIASIVNGTGASQRIRVSITDTGFTFPGALGSNMLLTSTAGVSAPQDPGFSTNISGTFVSSVGLTNLEYQTSVSTPTQVLVAPPGPATESTQFIRPSIYSITNVLDVTVRAGQTFSFTGTTNVISNAAPPAVPAPAAIVLAATALPFFGVTFLRRRKAIVA